jgi:hypothetical protein
MAGALFRGVCGLERSMRDVLVLLGYSYLALAADRPFDAVVFLYVSIALARGKRDAAAELLRKIGLDLDIVNFACGAVELAELLEKRGVTSIPEQ